MSAQINRVCNDSTTINVTLAPFCLVWCVKMNVDVDLLKIDAMLSSLTKTSPCFIERIIFKVAWNRNVMVNEYDNYGYKI